MNKTALYTLVALLIIVIAVLLYKIVVIALPFIIGGLAWTAIVFVAGYILGRTAKKPVA